MFDIGFRVVIEAEIQEPVTAANNDEIATAVNAFTPWIEPAQ